MKKFLILLIALITSFPSFAQSGEKDSIQSRREDNESINSILADSLINMCFFKKSPIKLISNFINKILESENQENTDLKNLILKKIREVKNEERFLYQMPEKLEKKYKDKKIKEET